MLGHSVQSELFWVCKQNVANWTLVCLITHIKNQQYQLVLNIYELILAK